MQHTYDRLAKDVLLGALGPVSFAITAHRELDGDALFLDLWCNPDPRKLRSLRPLGMLHRIARAGPCAFEFFHRAPTLAEALSSLRKTFFLRREATLPARADEPWLWIIAGGRPSRLVSAFELGCAKGWPSGVYVASPALRFRLIVTSELPVTPDTLLLRSLGAGKTLRTALRELHENGLEHPVTRIVAPLVVRLHIEKRNQPGKRDPEDEEFVMETQDIYEAWQQRIEAEARRAGRTEGLAEGRTEGLAEGRTEGLAEGRTEGQIRSLFAILEARGLEITPELRARVRACRDLDRLELWLRRAATAARCDEVFA
jgi:hypothetical protein